MRAFRVGDEVQMEDDAPLSSQYPTLRQARGRVTGAVPDGTTLDKITVEYPDGTKLQGVGAAQFKRAGS